MLVFLGPSQLQYTRWHPTHRVVLIQQGDGLGFKRGSEAHRILEIPRGFCKGFAEEWPHISNSWQVVNMLIDREGALQAQTKHSLVVLEACVHGLQNIMMSGNCSIVLARVAALLALGSMVASCSVPTVKNR